MKKSLFYLLMFLICLAVPFGLAETYCRIFLKDYNLQAHHDERNLCYRFDEELGWFPVPDREINYKGTRTITIKNNSLGFRDTEFGAKTKPRMVFLGDSMVFGYDVEQDERFTEKLQARVPGWQVLNLGVSGYGTDQEYLLLKKYFDRLQPDMIFLVFHKNDYYGNVRNLIHKGYYKPYYEIEQGALALKGVPVPKSVNYYLTQYPLIFKSLTLNILIEKIIALKHPFKEVSDPTRRIIESLMAFTRSKNVPLCIVFIYDDPGFSRFCKINKLKFINVSNDLKYPEHGEHWTPAGHRDVSDKIYKFLRENKLVQ